MKWTLGPVESMLKTEEQISIIFAIGVRRRADAGVGLDHAADHRPAAGGAGGAPCATSRAATSSRRVPVDDRRRGGAAVAGFNRMLERLSQADAQIRAFNQRLAAEIEAATHDLSEKNATLAQLNRLLNDMRRDNASKVRLATLGQLAAQLAHEIGTPLSSVSGHLQLALRERDLPPALRERLDVSAREIERISRSCATTWTRRARWSPSASRPRCRACWTRRSRSTRRRRPRSRRKPSQVDRWQIDAGHRRLRHRPGPAAPDRRQPADQRARRRRAATGRVDARGAPASATTMC